MNRIPYVEENYKFLANTESLTDQQKEKMNRLYHEFKVAQSRLADELTRVNKISARQAVEKEFPRVRRVVY